MLTTATIRRALRTAKGDRDQLVSILRRAFPALAVQEGRRDEPIELWDNARDAHAPALCVDICTGASSR